MPQPKKGSLNCAHCHKYFTDIKNWWKHRIGPHNKRRCMTTPEMFEFGFRKQTNQKWRYVPPETRGPTHPRHRTAV